MPGELSQASSQDARASGRRWVTLLIVSAGLLVLASFLFLKFSGSPSLRLETCFQDVNGLRSGAKVRLAGVGIGAVREVRAQPTNKACPAAVEMEIRTPYELRIPKDSVASTDTAGILGETFVEIDVSGANGAAIQSGGHLPSKESVKFTDQARKFIESLKHPSSEEKKCNSQAEQPSLKRSPSSTSR